MASTSLKTGLSSTSRLWFASGMGCFLVATLFGCLMRFSWIVELPGVAYKHILHAHSHLALLGWAFMLIGGGLVYLLLPEDLRRAPRYRWVLGLNLVAAIGMAVAFSYQGYGAVSISFCAVHLVAAYLFGYQYLRDIKQLPAYGAQQLGRWAIYWLLISTLGLWGVGPVSAMLGKLHPLYFASIQFFLHFQFNGWLTFGLLALLVNWLSTERKPIRIPNSVFWLLQASLVLTYALSVSWSTPLSVVFYLNSAGVLLQLAAFFLLWRLIAPVLMAKTKRSRQVSVLLWVGLGALTVKIIVQSAVAIPAIAKISYTIHNFVIGFIHLAMIGSITLVGVALLLEARIFPNDSVANAGYTVFLSAFLTTELLLFGQGCLLWAGWGYLPLYYEMILGCSLLFPIALSLLLTAFWRARPVAIARV